MSGPPTICPQCGAELLVDEEHMYGRYAEAYPDILPWQQWVFYCKGKDEHIYLEGQLVQFLPPNPNRAMTWDRRLRFQEHILKAQVSIAKINMTPEASLALLDYLIELERIILTARELLPEDVSTQALREQIASLPTPTGTRPF